MTLHVLLHKITRKAVIVLFALLPLCAMAQMPWNTDATYPKHETRAVWVTTLSGLDWPKTKATDEAGRKRQQEELCTLLDQLQAANINTVLFQVRIRGSVVYPSNYEPWDTALTGTYDRHPGYDPLQFAIEESHRRGMELHAWIVSVPAFKPETARKMGRRSLLVSNPQLLKKHGDMYYLDPAQAQSADYLAGICREIVMRYDVDGIHLDYIRYPEQANTFPDALSFAKQGGRKSKAQWRRDNITRMVAAVSRAVRKEKPWVKMSCSPVGKFRDTKRQSAYGWNSFDAVYQDCKAWLREGWMDMLFPMMYFDGRHFYPFVADWKEDVNRRPVIPGLGIYFLSPEEKNWPLSVITAQLNTVRGEGLGGEAFFRSKFLTDNVKGLYSHLKNSFYAYPALPTPTPWLDSKAPTAPQNARQEMRGGLCWLTWDAATDNVPSGITYNVYASRTYPVDVNDARYLVATRLREPRYAYNPLEVRYLAITSMDRAGNESWPYCLGGVEDLVISPSPALWVQNGMLSLPKYEGVEFFLITDLSGHHLLRGPWKETVNIRTLQPGVYRLRTLQRKGVSRSVGVFIK